MQGPTIRAYRDDDLDGVRGLVITTIERSYSGEYSAQAIQFFKDYHSLENIRSDATIDQTVVVLEHGSIIGTGTLLGNNIRRVFVLPEHQGRGLGGRIMAELEKRAAEAGVEVVDLDSSTASVDFYRRREYQGGAASSIELKDGERLDYLPMWKRIGRKRSFQTLAAGAEDRGPAPDPDHGQ